MGEGAFSDCKELTSVIIQNHNLQFNYDEVFDGCTKLQRSNVVYEAISSPSKSSQPAPTIQQSSTTTSKSSVSGSANQQSSTITEGNQEDVFQMVEEMPLFPGGEQKMSEFITSNINYPEVAREAGVQGRVYVRFVVEQDGSISNVKVMRGIGSGCDEEAMRVIKSMPKWKPGKQHGKTVRVSHQIPVNFSL
jgi:protein TonB